MAVAERSSGSFGVLTEGAIPLRVAPESLGVASGSRWLRWLLMWIDASGALIGWSVPLVLVRAPGPLWARSIVILSAVAAALAAIGVQRLYRSRVAAVRAVELVRVTRAASVSAAGAYLAAVIIGIPLPIPVAAVGAALAFLLLASGRSFYDAWIKLERTRGRFLRPMLLVGANADAADLNRLLSNHPELGFRVAGYVGDPEDPNDWVGVPQVGSLDDVCQAVRRSGTNGVLVAASALTPEQFSQATRELLCQGVHVHVSSGLKGIAPHRVRHLPFAHEPLFYLEPITLSPWQLAVKKTVDLVLATAMLLLALPILAVAAVAIKLGDGGPVIFRQQRVGRDGKPFGIMKLRTMRPDAERYRADLENERVGGPLFKLTNDPRRTRIGRVLERLSVDELPQLWNVLRGDMSLVGPRPALPAEVEQFDTDLLIRLSVPPGLTGLWQIEARDNPSFYAYRRLDMFYVENWSVLLDFSILLGTVRVLLVRFLHPDLHTNDADLVKSQFAATPRTAS
jgi:exopolysaccharide biosynthesis polyprenyl glycosylphosphotransferase